MFEVGFTEIILILGLALLVLGPEKLPGLAQKVGRWTGRARSMARQLRTQLEQEVTLEELAKSKAATPKAPTAEPDMASTSDPGADAAAHVHAVHEQHGCSEASPAETCSHDNTDAPPTADGAPEPKLER